MVHFCALLHDSSTQKHMLSALYAIARLFRSVRPSVTRVDQSKTVKVMIMKFSFYGSFIPSFAG